MQEHAVTMWTCYNITTLWNATVEALRLTHHVGQLSWILPGMIAHFIGFLFNLCPCGLGNPGMVTQRQRNGNMGNPQLLRDVAQG